MGQRHTGADDDGYTVRLAEPSDREGFLSLYEDVWDRSKSEEWFDWRFERDPFSDRVEMVVAEHAGTLVGAEPLLPMPLATESSTVEARQPVDWIVHSDHRRRGVFTQMTEHLLSAYEDRAALLFNFPSEALRPGLEKFDWTTVSEVATRYRIQDPRNLVADGARTESRAATVLGRVGGPAARAGLGAADRLASASSDISVVRVDGVATSAVRAVYSETRPEKIHVPREEAFLGWRFANPRWETTTYVARSQGHPRATVVVGTETMGDVTVALLLDIQPMATDPDRAPAFAAALDAALDDLAVDVVKAPATPFPSVLGRRGFLRDDSFPLSRFTSPRTHVVRPLSAPEQSELERDAFEADNWLFMLGDCDVD